MDGLIDDDVASIYIGHEDMDTDRRNVTYLVHDWQDPLIDDDVLMDTMRDVVRTMLRRLYTTGVYPPDHLRFLETCPSQMLEIRVWCKTAEADCTLGWVKYLRGSIWFELGLLERDRGGFRIMGDFRGQIKVRSRPSTLVGYVRDGMGRNPAMMQPGIQDDIPEHLRVSQQHPQRPNKSAEPRYAERLDPYSLG